MPTPVTAVADGPAVPDSSVATSTFDAQYEAFNTWEKNTLRPGMNALAAATYTNAVETDADALAAAASASAAAASAVAAGAILWVSGTTYAIGDTRIAPLDLANVYRRKTAGAGTTDPSADSTNWVKIVVGTGQGGTTITGNVTLTASSAAAMTVTPTAPGLYATLPDATTCTKADNLYSIYNAGDFDYGVKDSAGTQLGWIRARTGAMIGLADNATAAGVWAYYGLEKLGITASFSNAALTGMDSSNTIRRITLDANRTCFLIGGLSCYAIVYDASTQTWGSATLVRASIGSGRFAGVLSATNQVLIFTCDTSTAGQAVTLTIAGTGVTVNTPVAKTLPATISSASAMGAFVPVSTSWVFAFATAAATYVMAFSVSGTVPTVGTESVLIGDAGIAANLYVSGSIVRCVTMVTASSVNCRPYTVSGVTLTAGTTASPGATGSQYRSFVNGNGNIVCHYINTTHFATIFKLTGTVEAPSSVSLGVVPAGISSNADYVQVTAGKTAFLSGASATWSANILTDTSGTATAGTEVTGVAAGTPTFGQLPSTGNTASFAMAESSGTYSVRNFDCSGASPVATTAYRTALSSTTTITALPATITSGVRATASLVSGQTAYSVALGVPTVGEFSANGAHTRVVRPPICASLASTGETGSVGYATATISSTVGVQIQKIEAAA